MHADGSGLVSHPRLAYTTAGQTLLWLLVRIANTLKVWKYVKLVSRWYRVKITGTPVRCRELLFSRFDADRLRYRVGQNRETRPLHSTANTFTIPAPIYRFLAQLNTVTF